MIRPTLEAWWKAALARPGLGWALFLLPLSWIYAALAALKARLFFRPVEIAGLAVVSVGNLSVGGTGKTPLVIALARRLSKRGRVCVLSRGYGRKGGKGTVLVGKGRGPLVEPAQAGDEPWLIARKAAGVAVVVDARRVRGARFAREVLGADILLLDDGFQQRGRLARRLDLLLTDAAGTPGAERCLPAGRLREPVSSAGKAHAWVLAPGQAPPLKGGGLAVLRWVRKNGRLRRLGKNRPLASTGLSGRKVGALSALGNPAGFERSLMELGAREVAPFRFPDHHPFNAEDLALVLGHAAAMGLHAVVTTEKDEARLRGLPRAGRLLVLETEAALEPWAAWETLLKARGI